MSIQATYRELLEVVRQIEVAWRAHDNELLAFSDIVAEQTEGRDFSSFGELENMTALLEDAAVCALQEPSTFSDVYLKLYDNGRFYVEVLNWWGSDINIHDHDFSGMQFQLEGRSLNVEYAFAEEHWSPRLTEGVVSVKKAEIWREGDRSVVRPGTVAAHTVNHLDFPTVSLLIRTHGDAAYGPQRNYFPPFVAGSYGVADIVFRKRVRLLRVLARGPIEGFQRAFRSVVAAQTPTENLFTMIKLHDFLFLEQNKGLLREFMRSGGDSAEAIVRAVAYHRATDCLINSIKRTEGLTQEQILTCSVLGSCFDPASFAKVTGDLATDGVHVDLPDLVEAVERNGSREASDQLRNIIELFGLGGLVGRPRPSVAVPRADAPSARPLTA